MGFYWVSVTTAYGPLHFAVDGRNGLDLPINAELQRRGLVASSEWTVRPCSEGRYRDYRDFTGE